MPYITLEGGKLDSKQKEELIMKLTSVASEVMQVPKEFFIMTIKEFPDENIGIGGKTINKVKEEYGNKE